MKYKIIITYSLPAAIPPTPMTSMVATSRVELSMEKRRPVKSCPENWSVGDETVTVKSSSPIGWVSVTVIGPWSAHVGLWKHPSGAEEQVIQRKSDKSPPPVTASKTVFFPRTISLWNKLPASTAEAPDLVLFKQGLSNLPF